MSPVVLFWVLLPSLKDERIEESNHLTIYLQSLRDQLAMHGTGGPVAQGCPQADIWVLEGTRFLPLHGQLLKETKCYMLWCASASHTMPCKQKTESLGMKIILLFYLKVLRGIPVIWKAALRPFKLQPVLTPQWQLPAPLLQALGTGSESPNALYSLLLALLLGAPLSCYRNPPWHPPNLGEAILWCCLYSSHSLFISNGLPSLHCWHF